MIPLILWALVAQETPAPQETIKPPEARIPLLELLKGSITMRYRSRWTSGASDTDLFEVVQLRMGDPEKDLFSGALSARFAEDLDGERSTSGFFAFDSIEDSYRRGSTGFLYTAYLDVRDPIPGFLARVGRQVLEVLPEAVPIDGALGRVEIARGVNVTGFGGVPVNLFESSTSEDLTWGGWLEAEPWPRGIARIEAMHLEDENLFGKFRDDLLGLFVSQGFGSWDAQARYTLLEGDSRGLVGRISGAVPEIDLVLSSRFEYAFRTQHALSYAVDPYATFLLELEPYLQVSLRAARRFGAAFELEAAIDIRELTESGTEGRYNREFEHGQIIPRLSGWPHRAFSPYASIDYWDSDTSFWTAGGGTLWEPDPKLQIDIGTSYTLYRIDPLSGEERERVRSFYSSLRFKVDRDNRLDLKFSHDRDDLDRFSTFEIGFRRAF